eukprot:jgi/Chlat1/4798/Chrsp31S04824
MGRPASVSASASGFSERRAATLRALQDGDQDRSIKGSVDAPISALVADINSCSRCFTLSSCSGRTSLFTTTTTTTTTNNNNNNTSSSKSKGCVFLYVSHECADADSVWEALQAVCGGENDATLKYEPFILAAECDSLDTASDLVQCARACGYRESGITCVKGRFVINVRCSIRLEAPVAVRGEVIASATYVARLIAQCNAKQEANLARIARFHTAFIEMFMGEKGVVSGGGGDGVEGRYGVVENRQREVLRRVGEVERRVSQFAASSSSQQSGEEEVRSDISVRPVIIAPKSAAKRLKDALKSAGLLDRAYHPFVDFATDTVAFPITDAAATTDISVLHSDIIRDFRMASMQCTPVANGKATLSPCERLSTAVRERSVECGVDIDVLEGLMLEVPKRWEILGGDIAMLPADAFADVMWVRGDVAEALWPAVAKALSVTRVARQASVASDDTRSSRASMLYAPGHVATDAAGWVEHKEGGVIYAFDVTRCMFSSGNTTERQRMGRAISTPDKEVVVDLFAGIGYYTLQFLVKGRAKHVHACDWNPHAVTALKRALHINRVHADRCTVYEGDNTLTAPKGVADRVCLGLLPSSARAWRTAVQCLKPASGGVLHVHGNVDTLRGGKGSEQAWAQEVVKSIASIAESEGLAWEELVDTGCPVVISGLDCAPASRTWTPTYLMRCPDAHRLISAHVCTDPCLDFTTRNFKFEVMPFCDFIARASDNSSAKEFLYLRSINANPRKEPSDFAALFPHLAGELSVVRRFVGMLGDKFFSSVLRVGSKGCRLWTHYDVMANVLIQVVGSKRVVLFPPSEEPFMYMEGSSSRVLDIDTPDPTTFPLFAKTTGFECVLQPGQALYIPPLWMHNVVALDLSVSVNVFWRDLSSEEYPRKDLYGNADPVAAGKALALVSEACAQLRGLPEVYRSFYGRRAVRVLEEVMRGR